MMRIGKNPTRPLLFFLLIFFMVNSFKLSYCIESNSIVFCPETEKQALLSFKQSLDDPSNLLSSWTIGPEVNCCKWKGVVCSNLTGRVHQLHLRSPDPFQGLRGKLNPSLLSLKGLKFLDLSQNNFEEAIPSFIGSFTSLEYLNLSFAGFHGTIPHNIGNLSNLHALSLEVDDYQRLNVDSIGWLSGLSQLEYLNMNNVNLSKAVNWVQVINTLPSLVELHFSSCNLEFMAPLSDVNITSLAILDLSRNNFESFAIPKWIFRQSNLVFLNLSRNSFEGPIPTVTNTTKLRHFDLSENELNYSIPDWLYFCQDLELVSLAHNSMQNTISNAIGNLTSLNTLDLSYNELSGKIPREIANLCKIQMLDIRGNKLEGEISDSFGNMSACFLASLKYLGLWRNRISGQIPDEFGKFKSLQYLDLSLNSLSGAIPISLGKMSTLKIIWIGGNKLTGNLPESMGQLFNLETLSFRYNKLEGVVTENHFANLTKLKFLSASQNHLTLKVSPNWIPPFKLEFLALGSWGLGAGSAVPSWIQRHRSIRRLDLSNTGISGVVPSWFWELNLLNFSLNQLHGEIPDTIPLQSPDISARNRLIYLSSNKFSGSLPRLAKDVTELDLSNNSFSGGISHFLCHMTNGTYTLEILHLGGNQLTGEIPDCWMKWPSLRYVNLGDNKMFGHIPNSIGFLANLQSLNLYGNQIFGQIPLSMHNCTELLKIDLAGNYLSGNIPTWMGTSLAKLKILILGSNKFNGEIPSSICHLNALQILDLSGNVVSGTIPKCINNFTAMATKRSLAEYGDGPLFYSSYLGVFPESALVVTKGNQYHYDTILSLVTNIDLSNNNLSGDIPRKLTSLVELRSLNLSGNRFTGSIPQSIGDMKQLESLDLSRNSLFGKIPNSFTIMFSLNNLNLSYNNLVGRIPESTQLRTMNASSFIGNNLCGPPLPSNCSHDNDEASGPLHKQDKKDDTSEINWFYVLLFLGYFTGFSVVCTVLVSNKSWREAYFGL